MVRAAQKSWRIRVPAGCESALGRKLLGLTFFERRLREARKYGIACVVFELAPSLTRAALPEASIQARRCAPYQVVVAAVGGDGLAEVHLAG